MHISQQMQQYADRVNHTLTQWLAQQNAPEPLKSAMQHAVLLGGKRIRPFLVYCTGEMLGVDLNTLDAPACAIELIHAYSLVHDDLPAMDDDDLRRGHPTCHIAFDEATAILAGDALQTFAFEILSQAEMPNTPDKHRLQMIQLLARSAGALGMVGGQTLDLQATNQQQTLAQLEQMHRLKTGQLIICSVMLGALTSATLSPAQHQALTLFADNIGLAFQVQDDILDIESNTEILGKPQGSDIENNKSTYPGLMGLQAAKQKAQDLYQTALTHLQTLEADALDTRTLQAFAQFIIQRQF